MLRICSLIVLILAGAAQADVRGAARVIDGDTLDVAGVQIRLFGVDAPELGQPCGDWSCGRWARDELARLIGGRQVTCSAGAQDRYGRLLARCDAGRGDLGLAMVQRGAAFAYRRYATDYVGAERQARASERGLWRDGGRGVTLPEDFRAAQQEAGVPPGRVPPRPDCAIKGNVSDSGRVYHLPGQRDYDRTRIDPARGERWFCSEAEARAAGWRRARR